eukprot:jgi/Ulvmu1/11454/UM076_0029.1
MTDAPDHAAATAATTAMLWYPAQILTDDSHNGLERRIAARILAHSEGRDPIQYEERRKKPRSNPAKQTTDQRTAARIHTKLTMHSLSRAAGCLAPGSIVQQPTPEDLANLQDLHPPGEPAQPPPIDTAAPHITVDDLERVLGNLPNSSAPGLSGWTLVPIRKPDGGIRPIAVQEVWVRIASLCALRACSEVGPSLAPLQVGVGISGGAQTMGHALSSAAVGNLDTVILSVDFKNAYNSIHTQSMLDAVHQRAPQLFPYAIWANTSPTQHHVIGAPPGTAPITSTRGVKQGDPLASILFSLTLQPALEAAQATVDPADAALLAYADDCSIRGTGAPIIKAFTTLEEHAHPIGLCIGRAKSAATSIIDRDAAQNVADATGVPLRPHGVTCAGTPIGHTPYVKDYCNRRATTACAKIDRFLSLPLPAQDKFLLLRGSVQLALTHLVRVVAWDSVKDAVQRLQDRVMAAAREIMHHPQMPTVAEEQLRLPLRHGGFGLMDVTEQEADAAYLSSAALAHDAMRDGPPDFRPFAEGDVATGLQEKWTALCAAMPPEADWGPEELDNVFTATGLPGADFPPCRR